MVDVEIVSGVFIGKPVKLQKIIKTVFIRAIITGVRIAIREYLPQVAQQTGQLRTGLENMIKTQVVGIRGRTEVIVGFNDLVGVTTDTGQDYSVYHIYGPHGQAKSTSPYKHPTTPGTKPISERKLLRLIKKRIKEQLILEVRQRQGIAMSVFDILSTN